MSIQFQVLGIQHQRLTGICNVKYNISYFNSKLDLCNGLKRIYSMLLDKLQPTFSTFFHIPEMCKLDFSNWELDFCLKLITISLDIDLSKNTIIIF